MRAILIDPFTKTVTEKDIPNGSYATIRSEIQLKGEALDRARIGSGVIVFVDDLGLRRKDQQFWFFDTPGGGVLMAGRGLAVSMGPDGFVRDLDYRVDFLQFKSIVRFLGDGAEVDKAMEAGILDRPEILVNGEIVWTWTPKEQVF